MKERKVYFRSIKSDIFIIYSMYLFNFLRLFNFLLFFSGLWVSFGDSRKTIKDG